jgi:hypothetical protein
MSDHEKFLLGQQFFSRKLSPNFAGCGIWRSNPRPCTVQQVEISSALGIFHSVGLKPAGRTELEVYVPIAIRPDMS